MLLYGLDGYASATQRIAQSHVKHAIDLYHAEHGKYPKDYKEFMDKNGYGIWWKPTPEFDKFLAEQVETKGKIMKEAGLIK